MKAVSLWQPWASAVAEEYKRNETRHWYTHYRGPLAIQAAKRWTPELRDYLRAFRRHCPRLPVAPPLGAIVATVNLIACVRAEEIRARLEAEGNEIELMLGNYEKGRWVWQFADIRPTLPMLFRGAQGFFDVPDSSIRYPEHTEVTGHA